MPRFGFNIHPVLLHLPSPKSQMSSPRMLAGFPRVLLFGDFLMGWLPGCYLSHEFPTMDPL